MVTFSRLDEERKAELFKRNHSGAVNIVLRGDGKFSGKGKLLRLLKCVFEEFH